MTSAGTDGEAAKGGTPGPSERRAPAQEPVHPEQSHEDTDIAWGDYSDTGDDRLYRDRPPHWADY